MELKEFKTQIENNSVNLKFYIFKYADNNFLPLQYIDAIKNKYKLQPEIIDSISEFVSPQINLFGDNNIDNSILYIYECDTFDILEINLLTYNNLIIVCKKLSKECEQLFKDNLIIFPKLESWQIKDYVYSLLPEINTKQLDELIALCGEDIFRLTNEIEKINIFNPKEQKYIYQAFIDEGIYSDLSQYNIFNFTNVLLKKDISAITTIYKEIEKIDCEPLGLVTTLYNNIKTIISIQLLPSASPESLGIPANRFWAIKKNNCGYYTKSQLLNIFGMLCDIDRMLKSGEITTDIMVDYVVCHMLSY